VKPFVFVTNNPHKVEEVRAILSPSIKIVSLSDLGFFEEIPETADTLEGNALLKAKYIYEKYGLNCFADDTGLEIEALGGEPGVFSARYAGEGHNSYENRKKVLNLMTHQTNRAACFRTVIVLILEGKKYFFEGKVKGIISEEPRGNGGFGYDPIFIPEGFNKTFAELTAEEKNQISHRALALKRLSDFLEKINH